MQSPSCPERAGERGGDDTAHAYAPPRSAPLRLPLLPAARRRATRSHAGTPSHWGSSTSLPGHAPRAASDPGTCCPFLLHYFNFSLRIRPFPVGFCCADLLKHGGKGRVLRLSTRHCHFYIPDAPSLITHAQPVFNSTPLNLLGGIYHRA